MIKSELINALTAKMTNQTEEQVAYGINRILEMISNYLVQRKRVEIRGFGSFSLRYRKPRNAHNPKTGEQVLTVAKYSSHFKPGKELKERINVLRDQFALNIE